MKKPENKSMGMMESCLGNAASTPNRVIYYRNVARPLDIAEEVVFQAEVFAIGNKKL